MAVGRHFRDATPTAGTLFSAAHETMTLDVEVTDALKGAAATVLQAS